MQEREKTFSDEAPPLAVSSHTWRERVCTLQRMARQRFRFLERQSKAEGLSGLPRPYCPRNDELDGEHMELAFALRLGKYLPPLSIALGAELLQGRFRYIGIQVFGQHS
jgi:hypothetical protein